MLINISHKSDFFNLSYDLYKFLDVIVNSLEERLNDCNTQNFEIKVNFAKNLPFFLQIQSFKVLLSSQDNLKNIKITIKKKEGVIFYVNLKIFFFWA